MANSCWYILRGFSSSLKLSYFFCFHGKIKQKTWAGCDYLVCTRPWVWSPVYMYKIECGSHSRTPEESLKPTWTTWDTISEENKLWLSRALLSNAVASTHCSVRLLRNTGYIVLSRSASWESEPSPHRNWIDCSVHIMTSWEDASSYYRPHLCIHLLDSVPCTRRCLKMMLP